ncbi:MAG: hypothetical protein KGJ54_12575 [Betaproteobacteria bacterium]|nr:hypothetical protein [Betaproteobacteria bacterium]
MNVQTSDHVKALQAAMNRFWELRALVMGAHELLVQHGDDAQNAGFILLESAARLAEQYGADAWEAWEPIGDTEPDCSAPEPEHPGKPGGLRVRNLSVVPDAEPRQEAVESE